MLADKMIAEKRNSQYMLRVEEVFDRELAYQHDAVTGFMKDHFRYGKDPGVMKFSKACVTSQNMISMKIGYPNKAERVREDIEMRKLENVT